LADAVLPYFLLAACLGVMVLLILMVMRKKKTMQRSLSKGVAEEIQTLSIVEKSVSEAEAKKAQEEIRLTLVERDLVSSAMKIIYEAEAKGAISAEEKNQLIAKYSLDLRALEDRIAPSQRILDLFESETVRENLLKDFQYKLSQIDMRISELRSASGQVLLEKGEIPAPPGAPPPPSTALEANLEKKTVKEKVKTKAEERIEAIREEVLRAMERLEQIEAEG